MLAYSSIKEPRCALAFGAALRYCLHDVLFIIALKPVKLYISYSVCCTLGYVIQKFLAPAAVIMKSARPNLIICTTLSTL